jgi:NADH:ubiquinone oxidoreductase subunit 6 (subunit J)
MNSAIVRGLAVLAMALLFIGAITSVSWPEGDMDQTSNQDVGRKLFGMTTDTGYGIIVLLIGLLLLVALLGGIFLAKEEKE